VPTLNDARELTGAVTTLLSALQRTIMHDQSVTDYLPQAPRRAIISEIEAGIRTLSNFPATIAPRRQGLELTLGLALLAEDEITVASTLRGLETLDALGNEPKAADLLEFVETVTQSVAARQEVGELVHGGHGERALSLALQHVERWPGRAPNEFVLARLLLRAERVQEALVHARLAYLDMPGTGQLTLLAECLVANEDEASALSLLETADDSHVKVLWFRAIAAERASPGQAADLWRKYLEKAPGDWRGVLRLADLLRRMGRSRDAAQAVLTITINDSRIPPQALAEAARFLRGLPRDDREAKLLAIARQLAADYEGRPGGEGAYLTVRSMLADAGDLRAPDFKALLAEGSAEEFPVERLFDWARTAAQLREAATAAYVAGAITFEARCRVSSFQVPDMLAAMRSAEQTLVAAAQLAAPDATSVEGQTILVGYLELLVMARLALLPDFERSLGPAGRLAIFEDIDEQIFDVAPYEGSHSMPPDVLAALMEAASGLERHGGPPEISDIELARREGANILLTADEHEDESGPAIVRLGRDEALHLGALPRRLFVSLRALQQIGQGSLIADLARGGAQLVLGPQANASLHSEAKSAAEATRIKSDVQSVVAWSGALKEREILRVLPRPSAMDSPDHEQANVVRDMVGLALSWHRALRDDPSLRLLSVDFAVVHPFVGLSVHPLFKEVGWTPQSFGVISHEVRTVADRVLDFGSVVRSITPSARRGEMLRALQGYGVSDALDGDDWVDAARNPGPGGLAFSALVASAKRVVGDERSNSGAFARTALAGQLAKGAWRASLASEGIDEVAERAAIAFADAAEDLGADATGVALESFVFSLINSALLDPTSSLQQVGENRWNIGANTPPGRMWTAIGRWIRDSAKRRSAFSFAVARALLILDELSVDGGLNEVRIAPILLAINNVFANPDDHRGLIDACVAILSYRWRIKPFPGLQFEGGDAHHFDGESLLVAAAGALAGEGPRLRRGRTDGWLSVQAGGEVVVVPVPPEAAFVRVAVAGRQQAAGWLLRFLGPLDGRLYDRVTGIAASAGREDLVAEFASEAASAPWRLVVSHPEVVANWARGASLAIAFPHSIDELVGVLSEQLPLPNKDISSILVARVQDGIWSGRADKEVLLVQATAMLGSVGALLAGERSSERYVDSEVAVAAERLSTSLEQPSGVLVQDLTLLGVAALRYPERKTVAGLSAMQQFATTLQQLLEALIAPELPGTLAAVEHRLLVHCSRIVERIASRALVSHRDGLWLSYRLFQWFFHLVESKGCVALAAVLDSGERLTPPMPEVLDPIRFGRTKLDFRLAAVLGALHHVCSLVGTLKGPSTAFEDMLTDRSCEILLQLSERAPTTTEQELRALSGPENGLGWLLKTIAVPDLALTLCMIIHRPRTVIGRRAKLSWSEQLYSDHILLALPSTRRVIVDCLLLATASGEQLSAPQQRRFAEGILRAANGVWNSEETVRALATFRTIGIKGAADRLRAAVLNAAAHTPDQLESCLMLALEGIKDDKMTREATHFARKLGVNKRALVPVVERLIAGDRTQEARSGLEGLLRRLQR
jgi:hypothetical protein